MLNFSIILDLIKYVLVQGWEFLVNHWKAMAICGLGAVCFMLFSTNYNLNLQIDNLESENKILTDTINKAKEWDKEKTKIVDDHANTTAEIAQREENVIASLDELQRKAEEKLKDRLNMKEEEVQEVKKSHSNNVIDSVWSNYCRNNPTKKGC